MSIFTSIKNIKQKARAFLHRKDKAKWGELEGIIQKDKTSVEMEKEIWENID